MNTRLVASILTASLLSLCGAYTQDLANVGDIKVSFLSPAVRPSRGLMEEALRGGGTRETSSANQNLSPMPARRGRSPDDYGSFLGVVGGRIAALQVTWWDEGLFKNSQETADFVRGLLTTTNRSTWPRPPWAQGLGEPSVALSVAHTEGKVGTWLLRYSWPQVYCAYQDWIGRWWFSEWRGAESLRLECDQPQVLIQALASPDRETRLRAVRRLGVAAPGEKTAGLAVVPLLRESDTILRRAAVYALGWIREPVDVIVPALLVIRDDEAKVVRQAAANVLGMFPAQAKTVVSTLIAALDDPNPDVQTAALTSIMAMIHEADALPMAKLHAALSHSLDQKDDDVRRMATAALEELHLRASTRASLESNLKQIELAKRSWAFDHGATGIVDVTELDLVPYFNGFRSLYGFVRPVAMERYRINPHGVPAEAELTVDFQGLKKGTIIRLDKVIPSKDGQANGSQPIRLETNQTSSSGSRR